jgi:acetylornithine/succinyldiaminopimelate/putrescine aminotransferase
MTDNLSYAWRYIPLGDIMPTSRLLDDLERAGYHTAGDVMDVEITDLARNVRGVGLLRALEIRQKVFDHAKRLSSSETPNWVMAPDHVDFTEPTPSLLDTLVTMGAMITVALLVFAIVGILL